MDKFLGAATAVAAAVLLVGCAQTWNKAGATRDEFNRDKYTCLQQSQQQVSGFAFNKFGAAGSSNMRVNEGLFASCMSAQGWSLQQQNAQQTATQASAMSSVTIAQQTFIADAKATCARPDLQVILARSACSADEITLAQLADTTRLSGDERKPIESWREAVKARVAPVMQAFREHGGERGARLANVLSEGRDRSEKSALALYTGKITWGEFNLMRKEDSRIFTVEWQRANTASRQVVLLDGHRRAAHLLRASTGHMATAADDGLTASAGHGDTF